MTDIQDSIAPDLPGLHRLKALSPIGYSRNYANIHFALTFSDDGEPCVETVGKIAAENHLNTPDRTMLREMKRLSSGGFDITWGGESATSHKASLWKYPHLLHLLRGCSHFTDAAGNALTFSDGPATMVLRLSRPDDPNGQIETALVARQAESESASLRILGPENILVGTEILSIAPIGQNYAAVTSLISPIPPRLLEAYLSVFASYVDNVSIELNGVESVTSQRNEHSIPTIVLEKVAADRALYLRVTSTLASSTKADMPLALTRSATVTDAGQVIIRPIESNDIKEEADFLDSLITKSAPSRQAKKEIYRDDNFFIIPAETAGPFLINHLAAILQRFKLLGSEKLREYQVTAAQPKLNLRLSSGIDFLEGDADVTIGNQTFTIADILAQYNRNRYVALSDGNRAIVDEKYIARLQRLFNKSERKGRVKVTIFDLPEIEDLIKEKVKGGFASHAREVYEGFNKLKKSRVGDYKVNANLRPYQIEGVKWIKYLYDNSLGGCLADDMGLGKTLQTISVLSMIYPGVDVPSIIIMPRSLLFNWEKELSRFAPQIAATTYYGTGRDIKEAMKSQVILTTYATVRNDIEQLKDITFHYAILDESQNIKNVASQTSQAIAILKATHRLALSGTPMENNLTEIYSLFRFLNPAMFGSLDDFNDAYTNPIHRTGDQEAIDSLRRRIFPFMLRRLKRDVLKDLPDRIDQTVYVEMTPRQKSLYEEKRIAFRQQIKEAIAREGVNRSQFIMFQALSELRRIASVPETLSDGSIASPKVEELVESLETAVKNGHKAVVFFNFIAGIELVGDRLQQLGIQYETMTGSSSATQRKKTVGRFQTDPSCRVLLMTLKVGGVGLNLTAADTVYIFEPWWNKAAEEQAINRLHRIGQKATVYTYSVITVETIEEKIRQLQEQKAELFDKLINADTASDKHLSEADIDFILS
ncbi:MAG: DEAD/DEAH box helicase [Alloprevotella sp.]|nr:DEAD/DEAH box helicase [Alloprevotella sp.]